jgi:DNA polymerase-3 subunit delta
MMAERQVVIVKRHKILAVPSTNESYAENPMLLTTVLVICYKYKTWTNKATKLLAK